MGTHSKRHHCRNDTKQCRASQSDSSDLFMRVDGSDAAQMLDCILRRFARQIGWDGKYRAGDQSVESDPQRCRPLADA